MAEVSTFPTIFPCPHWIQALSILGASGEMATFQPSCGSVEAV
jgi:hypothetical protein